MPVSPFMVPSTVGSSTLRESVKVSPLVLFSVLMLNGLGKRLVNAPAFRRESGMKLAKVVFRTAIGPS